MLDFVKWLHLLAAATWTGGLIVLAALVFALRSAGAERALLQAAARQFGRVSWAAMIVAAITGVTQVVLLRMSWSYGRLQVKIGLVLLAIVVAVVHQVTAKRSSPAVRSIGELTTLLLGLAIFAAAVSLR